MYKQLNDYKAYTLKKEICYMYFFLTFFIFLNIITSIIREK